MKKNVKETPIIPTLHGISCAECGALPGRGICCPQTSGSRRWRFTRGYTCLAPLGRLGGGTTMKHRLRAMKRCLRQHETRRMRRMKRRFAP